MTTQEINRIALTEGISFDQYVTELDKKIEAGGIPYPDDLAHDIPLLQLNAQRMRRVLKTYTIDNELLTLLQKIETHQTWMVISEDWCGDSAQILPALLLLSEKNSNIHFRIIKRDLYPQIMDEYLSETGGRSIPVFVVYDESGNQLFKWGSRPQVLSDLVLGWKKENPEKEKLLEKIHLWYGRDRGQNLTAELKELFSKVLV